MNGPTQVTARIAAIQQRMAAIGRIAPPGGFQAALLRATALEPAATDATGTAVPRSRARSSPDNAVVVGILGTPVAVDLSRAPYVAPAPISAPATPAVLTEWAAQLPERGRAWAGAIDAAASEAGLDPRLLAALTWAESAFRADAVSHAGAMGLTQLMPATAAGLGVDPWDPAQNLTGGARYLAAQITEFGRIDHALAAYNAGPGRVRQSGGIPNIAETRAYVPKVLEYFRLLGGSA